MSVVYWSRRVPVSYIIHHERSDSSANLIVGLGFAVRTQQDEEKPVRTEGYEADICKDSTKILNQETERHPPCRYRDLGEASQSRGLSQTYERDEGFFQKIHLTNQDIGCFCITRNLLHEFILQLAEEKRKQTEAARELKSHI